MLKMEHDKNEQLVSFNSFLAGFLLTKSEIDDFEFFKLLDIFENTYNITVIGEGEESYLPIYISNTKICLAKNYDDIIIVCGKKTTVKDYLYEVSTPKVLEFFNIQHEKGLTRILFKKLFAVH